jgi:3-methylcrotonyl-CoA carboxylase alpha subunit
LFDKVLIANRGEIACRIATTATKIGLKTVAIFSEVDSGSKHVSLCDEAFLIESSTPLESYLSANEIIEIAIKTGAGAIHPGYGFLSENSEFAQKVEQAGLIFVGPDFKAIETMGRKDAAKKAMSKVGIPIVPGYHGDNQTDERLKKEAGSIGYPVLIKAVAGGGGKGMRLVESPKEFLTLLASARTEAEKAFGNGRVLIEKYITAPRHIEIQIFGDGQSAIHLFERDCSLQRRHQKVLEECPAPGMTDKMRNAMCRAAVRAAETIGYKGAGTVEFIVDGSDGLKEDKFWFMEMNTRLQVEHPITEEITGIDLVAWQLNVAMGRPMEKKQKDISIEGHSFEARIYAEDPNNNFLPDTGKIIHLHFPSSARVDTGIRTGDIVSPFFDPMLAKIITHAKDRLSALSKLKKALKETEIVGIKTNVNFLYKLTENSEFKMGVVQTNLIEQNIEKLVSHKSISTQAIIAATMSYFSPRSGHSSYSHWIDISHKVQLFCNNEVIDVQLSQPDVNQIQIFFYGEAFDIFFCKNHWSFKGIQLPKAKKFDNKIIVFDNRHFLFESQDPFQSTKDSNLQNTDILSPMPGMVSKIYIENGSKVIKGQRILALEAMKMEYEVVAPNDCLIKTVNFEVGNFVQSGEKLCDFSEV